MKRFCMECGDELTKKEIKKHYPKNEAFWICDECVEEPAESICTVKRPKTKRR